MKPERASDLVTRAEYIGMARTLASRVQRDIQDLRVLVPRVVGEDADPQLKALTASAGKLVDRLDREAIDTHKACLPQQQARQRNRRKHSGE